VVSGTGEIDPIPGTISNIEALYAGMHALVGNLKKEGADERQLHRYANVCRRLAHPALCGKTFTADVTQSLLAMELALRGSNKKLATSRR
jgi:hypothetical protein